MWGSGGTAEEFNDARRVEKAAKLLSQLTDVTLSEMTFGDLQLINDFQRFSSISEKNLKRLEDIVSRNTPSDDPDLATDLNQLTGPAQHRDDPDSP